jgi:hypothetical protein
MDKIFIKILIVLSLLVIPFTLVSTSPAQAVAPTIDKTTIIVRANNTFYLHKPTNTTKRGWMPEMDYRINGPLASGSQLSVEMTTPDGKPWVAFDCQTSAVKAGETLKIEGSGRGLAAEKLSTATGLYGLKINLKNELQGTNQTVFTGRFKVGKFFQGEVTRDKDDYRWYVDYDWSLPMAEIYSRELVDNVGNVEQTSPLVATFWFRGDVGSEAVAYLIYNGQEISNTQESGKGTSLREQGISLFERFPFAWSKKMFLFTNTLVYNRENPNNHPNAFRMDKNPGEYEVKVLRKGKLVRAAKFSVGADGKIADNGISLHNELGTRRMTVLATVTGDEDGVKGNLDAWRTEAFYGNPLRGFGQ